MMVSVRGTFQLVFPILILLQMRSAIGFNSTAGDPQVKCIERERQALLTFKQGLVDYHGCLSSWGSEEEKRDCCKWRGVQCSNTTGHVVEFNLSGDCNFTGGPLFSQLGNLTSLQLLDLGDDNFFDTGIKNLDWLSHLSSLRYLHMSRIDLSKVNNWMQMVNKLPHLTDLRLDFCNLLDVQSFNMINNLTSLAVLDLSGNNLTALTFQWLFNFNFSSSLVELSLDRNLFQGLIPETFGHMTSLEYLELHANQFEGGIPKSFGNLCKLRRLYLSGNDLGLGGTLHELIGNLSGCLQQSLEHLALDYCGIGGVLSDQITNFSSLRVLWLGSNNLSGIVTKNIRLLSNLVSFDLSFNSFDGVITEEHFSTQSELRYLYLSSNPLLTVNFSHNWIPPFQLYEMDLGLCKLGPDFPSWLQTQRNYWSLNISAGGISGSIPIWFWNLTTSYDASIDLSSNQINGTLPDFSMKYSGFLAIDLSSNNLEGPLPPFTANTTAINLSKNKFYGSISSLCSITGSIELNFLDLSYNQLSGELSDCLMRWPNLIVLNLANNHFFGIIPSSVGSLSLIETINLQNNSFSGEIPRSLGDCSHLRFVGMSYNKFSGILPNWIGERLSSLNFLILKSNHFYGEIPLQICQLTNILLLDLSNNNLSGQIPWCIGNLTALARKDILVKNYVSSVNSYEFKIYVDKALVVWKGVEHHFEYLKYLRIIDLSSNKLTGGIPMQIWSLFELVQLNLSRNHLTGRMSPDIGQMGELESLDLSHNRLSGWLPSSMSQLHFLNTLDLSYNNFSGRIPSSTQLQSLPASAFVGNPALCGLPLPQTCPSDEKPTNGGVKYNQDIEDEFWKGFKPSMGLGMAFGILGVLCFKLDWKHVCFLLFNYMKVYLNNLKDYLCLIVAALCLVITVNAAGLRRKLKF